MSISNTGLPRETTHRARPRPLILLSSLSSRLSSVTILSFTSSLCCVVLYSSPVLPLILLKLQFCFDFVFVDVDSKSILIKMMCPLKFNKSKMHIFYTQINKTLVKIGTFYIISRIIKADLEDTVCVRCIILFKSIPKR